MPLPEALHALFWDCDVATLDAGRDREFVTGRILASGTWDAIGWAREVYGDAAIRDWILRHRGRTLSSPQVRLWELLLDLPAAEVAEWLASPERRTWEGAGIA